MSLSGQEDGREGARAAADRTEELHRSTASAEPRTLPLNSRRLTLRYLKQLAGALGVPRTVSASDIRQLVEGAITELGREPRNVQVLLREAETGTTVCLQDEGGLFFTAAPLDTETQESPTPSEHSSPENGGESAEELRQEIQSMRLALDAAGDEGRELRAQVRGLTLQLEKEKARTKELWRINCAQLADFDATLALKEEEIECLQHELSDSHSRVASPVNVDCPDRLPSRPAQATGVRRRGKAPPVDAFTGEDPEIRFEDWLPSLRRATTWNDWDTNELLLQLAGHLRGCTLQEYNLVDLSPTQTFEDVVQTLQSRLDPGGKALAAQDFRHASQEKGECVGDFVRRLERTFRVAYGGDGMLPQTRNALLFSQLQEGLRQSLMEASAVSGATEYQSLCLAAKNEERRQAALRNRKGYQKSMPPPPQNRGGKEAPKTPDPTPSAGTGSTSRKCYVCGKAGHIAKDCRAAKRTESGGRGSSGTTPTHNSSQARRVQAAEEDPKANPSPDPLSLLYSSSDEEDDSFDICQVRVTDEGSKTHCAQVSIQGIPVYGLIDSGADITIIGGALFKRVAAVARLKKRDFKAADKTPRTYNQQSFQLDGRMDLEVSFGDRTMRTPVYIKMDAHDQLLLSEGVCRQLGILTYHPDMECWRGRRKKASKGQISPKTSKEDASVPMVRVKLVQTVRLDPGRSTQVTVQLTPPPLAREHHYSLRVTPSMNRRQGSWWRTCF